MINGISDTVLLNMQIKEEPLDDIENIQNENNVESSQDWSIAEGVQPSTNIINEYKRKEMKEQIINHIDEKRRKIMSTENQGSSSELNGNNKLTDVTGNDQSSITSDNKCYICDIVFVSQEELVIHMTIKHKRKNNARRQIGRFARHTCQVCFAKFRTLKDFFNHTSCHSGHSDIISSMDDEIGARVSRSINKNALQHYILETSSSLERSLLQPSFKCDQCHSVFINRDAYAMHVMMSVKNQCCKQSNAVLPIDKCNDINRNDILQPQLEVRENGTAVSTENDLQLAYYEDITSKTEKDEYLQLFLEKSNLKSEETKTKESVKSIALAGKKCFFCDETFVDKDTLAMHVMSRHSNDVTLKRPKGTNVSASPAPVPQLVQYFTAYPGNELVAIRTDILSCDFCEKKFTNRDALAMHVLSHSQENDSKMRHNKRKPLHTTKFDLRLTKSPNAIGEWSNNQSDRLEQNVFGSSIYNSETSMADPEPLNLAANKEAIALPVTKIEDVVPASPSLSDKNYGRNVESYTSDDIFLETNNTNEKSLDTAEPINLTKVRETARAQPNVDKLSDFRIRCTSLPDLRSVDKPFPERCSSTGVLDLSLCLLTNEATIKQTYQEEILYRDERGSEDSTFGDGIQNCLQSYQLQQDGDYIFEKQNSNTCSEDNFHICQGIKEEVHDANGNLNMETDNTQLNPMEDVLRRYPHFNICKFCDIIFPTKTLYYLHMGLHNVNNPWQCNMCGKACNNVNDFSAHVIHFG